MTIFKQIFGVTHQRCCGSKIGAGSTSIILDILILYIGNLRLAVGANGHIVGRHDKAAWRHGADVRRLVQPNLPQLLLLPVCLGARGAAQLV